MAPLPFDVDDEEGSDGFASVPGTYREVVSGMRRGVSVWLKEREVS